MADNSKIEWTDATWNPITGCTIVSPGCTNCYAMKLAGSRMKNHWSRKGLTVPSKAGPVWNGEVRLNLDWLDQPLHWRKPRKIFVCAHGDLFHENVPDEWIDHIFATMALCPQHTFQVLTKRAARMREYLTAFAHDRVSTLAFDYADSNWGRDFAERIFATGHGDWNIWPLLNVHLGVSVEDQTRADERIPLLLQTPAAVRFISAEPLLGLIDLSDFLGLKWERCDACGCRYPEIYWADDYQWANAVGGLFAGLRCPTCFKAEAAAAGYVPKIKTLKPPLNRLDQVIVGGESGPGARPMHPDWVRSLRDQCEAAGVAFHFKQWGEWAPAMHDPDAPHILRQTEKVGDFDGWSARVYDPTAQSGINWRNLGKKCAGRNLDGREWNGVPG